MFNPIFLIINSIIFFLICSFFVVTAIKRKQTIHLIFAFLSLVVCVGCLLLLSIYAASKATSKLKRTVNAVTHNFDARTGEEIYIALFGKPADNCLKVINQKDQIVPRLDCCIWLEFQTCAKELDRIIYQHSYVTKKYSAKDTAKYIPDYSPRPEWWIPQVLGDTVIVLQEFNTDDPNHDKILIFAKDSSHGFYCDMAE